MKIVYILYRLRYQFRIWYISLASRLSFHSKPMILDEGGGLGITQATLVSAIADNTGDDSSDAVIKIKRLINTCGPDFCLITNWPFLRHDLSFTISNTTHIYSGSSYLPATFRKVMGVHIEDANDWYPLREVSIREKHHIWINPANNPGRPSHFCITRPESGFWEIEFNRLPDQAYTTKWDIELQWTDLADVSDETVITKEYYTAFVHYVTMSRLLQQGDETMLRIYQKQWWDPLSPQNSILGRILASLRSGVKRKSFIIAEDYLFPVLRQDDYRKGDYGPGRGGYRVRGAGGF